MRRLQNLLELFRNSASTPRNTATPKPAGRKRRSAAARRLASRWEALERRDLLSGLTYVTLDIVNNTQMNSTGSGLADDEIYLFFTQESINKTWTIDGSTGVATPNAVGTAVPEFTLEQLQAAGGSIKIDSCVEVDSARIYLSNSPGAVVVDSTTGTVSGPTASTAEFYYDFFEFAMNNPPGLLNIDTTQVDQLGIPLTLQVTPNDPNFPAGSGVIATLDRQTLIDDYQTMATGSLTAFADSVIKDTTSTDPSDVFRLLNPSDVISGELLATSLTGTIATSGTPGNWQATFTITGPGSPVPTNGGLSVGMHVSGPTIPAGTTVSSLPGSPSGQSVVMSSSLTDNPFTASTGDVQLFFLNPPETALATYFDQAIDDFFNFYKQNPNTLFVEQNSSGTNVVYTGNVVQLPNIPDIDGGMSTYTVLQFTGNGEVYNVYYPFFTTNASATRQTPFGAAVPPPPMWWNPNQGLKFFEPPSAMVFGADGVFADNVQQNTSAPNHPNANIQGAIENVLVTALARGYATTWQFRDGTINFISDPMGGFSKMATVDLAMGQDTAGLTNQMFLSSFQIANVPMTPMIPGGSPVSSFTVTSPLPIPPTAPDLLTFSQFYPAGGTWSAFANFLHNGAGYEIMIDGRAYALPFDDQGGFSSDLNSSFTESNPAQVTVTLGPWTPRVSSLIVDNGDPSPAYSEVGDLGYAWNNQGFSGDVREVIGPGKSATYTFDGLLAGDLFDVSTTWTPFLNRETKAPHTIQGAVGGPVTRLIDQTLPPNDFTADGADWEQLGTFEVAADGTLTVTLSGTNIRSVIADAVRIDRRVDAEIVVTRDGNPVSDNGPAIDLGSGLSGSTVSEIFTIGNAGATALEVGGTLNLPAGFALGSNNSPPTLFDGITSTLIEPGDVATFEVLLDTTTPGVRSGQASFATNDADESLFRLNLTGTVLGNTLTIDDGDPGYSDSGNMITWLQGHQSDVREAVQGGVAQSATYTFSGLPAGDYRISATWTPYYNRATNAPFTINAGTPIPVNQKLSPSHAAVTPAGTSIWDAGSHFADLASSFSFTGGTLTVGVSDNGANGNVIIDAVRVERLPSAPAAAGPVASPTAVLSAQPLASTAQPLAPTEQPHAISSPLNQPFFATLGRGTYSTRRVFVLPQPTREVVAHVAARVVAASEAIRDLPEASRPLSLLDDHVAADKNAASRRAADSAPMDLLSLLARAWPRRR